MVVGLRQEFNQNFSDDSDTRLFLIRNRNAVKIFDDLAAHLAVGKEGRMLAADKGLTAFEPFFMNGIGLTLYFFIRTHTVETAHE